MPLLDRRTFLRHTAASGVALWGSTFSPDGQTLFVNIQATDGISVAVWGPWARIGV